MSTHPLVVRRVADGTLVAPVNCGLLAVPGLLLHVQQRGSSGRPVIVDLSEVDVIDMAAIRVLVWARLFCAAHAAHFGVVAPPSGVLQPHEDAILRLLLPVHQDRRTAWAAQILAGLRAAELRHQPERPGALVVELAPDADGEQVLLLEPCRAVPTSIPPVAERLESSVELLGAAVARG